MSFITFEGGEGTGKSVQANLLQEFLTKSGKDVLMTREPGGTPLAEEIRHIVLTGDPEKMDPLTESLLYLAARADHWTQKIKPSVDNKKIIICDRFHDSSVVYQGICKKVDLGLLNSIFDKITKGQYPTRTYLIDLDPKIGISRSISRENNNETRFEKMDISFHEKVRKAFLQLAKQDKKRFLVIDGTLSIQEIHEIIKEDIKKFI